jgi:Methylase involved in ubiquinone/menaquinone biosynthesis
MDLNFARDLLKKTKEDYDSIAQDFSRTRQSFWKELEMLKDYVKEGEKVLDIGCGNGRLFQILKDKNIEYTGIDFSKNLIELAKKKYPEGNFLVANALNLPFKENTFDKVFLIAVLHHIPSKELRSQVLKEAKRVLKPQGLLILTVWNLGKKE